MTTGSGVEESSGRLLEALYDLSGGKPTEPVPVGAPGEPGREAARRAGIEPGSTEQDVALRYLLDAGYVKAVEAAFTYTITISGIERVRQRRGHPVSSSGIERSGMSETTQRRLLTVLSILIAMGLSRPLTRFIAEKIPERRGIKDDLLEAALQGLVRAAAFLLASLVVRKFAGRR